MDELHCLNCNEELPEDNFCSRNALVLTMSEDKSRRYWGLGATRSVWESGWSRTPLTL